MIAPAQGQAVIAVDLGAQSCRVSLLRWTEGEPHIELVHRIPNSPVLKNGHLYWDLAALCQAADEGVRRCAAIANEGIAAIGVTGWAVDYVRLEPKREDGFPSQPIADPFCYRDARNVPALEEVHQRISPEKLYALTGIQGLPINTLYQLHADQVAGVPNHLHWLNLPEYMLYRWGGRPVAEYTNATHTGMVNLTTKQWSPEILNAAGIDSTIMPEIVSPGSIIGQLQGPLADLPALRNTLLIAPACHDTASAIASIHASGNDWAFISSGTWSLMGTLLDQPCVSAEAAGLKFTNEGGVGGTVCFLRNINALWLISQCVEVWSAAGEHWTTEALIDAAETLSPSELLIDVDDPELIAPQNMPQKIAKQLERKYGVLGRTISSPPAMVNLILHSLAAQYAACFHQVETLTDKKFRRLFVMGGGSRNRLLNRLTQESTGLDLICGSAESSTIGNFSVQLAALAAKDPINGKIGGAGVNREAVSFWAANLQNLEHVPSSAEVASQFVAPTRKESHL